MKALIEKLRAGIDLSPEDISYSVAVLLSPTASDDLKAQFLTALHQKGESAEEIAGFVRQLVDRAIDPGLEPEKLPGPMIDVCGTGGDGLDLFNVSTTIMFVLAAGGAIVVKHGNRAVTSRCGSADVLEQLGVAIDLAPDDLKECVERNGFGFIFARQYHPAFRAIAEMRGRLARQNTRTIFNLLGPLLNPARPTRQLIGVFAPRLTTVFGEVLRQLGHKRAWVVHGLGEDGIGMDDISISGATTVTELLNGRVSSAVLDVNWLGIARASVAELRGGDARENAATLEGILAGKITGPKRDIVVANAGGGFVAAGLTHDLKDGIQLAREELESGRALEKLRALQNYKPRRS
ncbi:MAG TPA: anthranilate phosphoribosyltransferase [Chthoniobacterales bacterium]|nr:anthranilate phosphoribosyltransferase [Chthoniobacterales bacterium]